jgi:hypothetical protein
MSNDVLIAMSAACLIELENLFFRKQFREIAARLDFVKVCLE